jgi:hypothetical protein
MSTSLPGWVLRLLLDVGRRGPRPELLARLQGLEWVDRLHWSTWEEAVVDLEVDDHFALLRGAVLMERHLRCPGGSVAASIWIARALVQRAPDRWAEFATWIRESAGDIGWLLAPWAPHAHLGPAEWAAYLHEQDARLAAHEVVRTAHAIRRQERVERGQARAAACRQRQTLETAERHQAILRLSTLAPVERLVHAILDEKVGLDYYPAEWAGDGHQLVSALDIALLCALVDRSRRSTGRTWRGAAGRARARLAIGVATSAGDAP